MAAKSASVGSRSGSHLASPVVAVVGRGHDRPPNATRMVHEQFVGRQPTQAEPEHVCLRDAEVVQQAHHVGGKVFEGHGPVDVGRAAVTLELDGDDPLVLGQERDGGSEAELDSEQATVE